MKPMNFPMRRRKRHLEAVIRNTEFRIRTGDRKNTKELVAQRQTAIDAMEQLSQFRDIRSKKKRN